MLSGTILYTLILVTNGGDVRHSAGYTSLGLCEEARSVATTGKTLATVAAEEEKKRAEKQERKAKWEAEHPPREPRSGDRCFQEGTTPVGGAYGLWCVFLPDGKVQDYEDSFNSTGLGTLVYLGSSTCDNGKIKYAECVIQPQDK